jgi:hypothetical protein
VLRFGISKQSHSKQQTIVKGLNMQSSNVSDMATSAVLSNRATHGFKMTDRAEFVMMLSNDLYSEKLLAALRETLANAWDAHTMIGSTDPIEITLTKEGMLTVTDKGPGIHDDAIVDTYCTYGGTTKEKDAKQTGGHGLGAKAPFSVADNFTVTSTHKGVRTIYALTRCEVKSGRPGCTAMASFPSTESGLSVSFSVGGDVHVARNIIKGLIHLSGRDTLLDGELIEAYEFEFEPDAPFDIPADSYKMPNAVGRATVAGRSKAFIRYGTIVYPLLPPEGSLMARFLDKAVPNNRNLLERGRSIFFQAPPNSLSITLNREGLAYSKQTLKTLDDLAEKAERSVRAVMKPTVNMIVDGIYGKIDENPLLKATDISSLSKAVARCSKQEVIIAELYAQHDKEVTNAVDREFDRRMKIWGLPNTCDREIWVRESVKRAFRVVRRIDPRIRLRFGVSSSWKKPTSSQMINELARHRPDHLYMSAVIVNRVSDASGSTLRCVGVGVEAPKHYIGFVVPKKFSKTKELEAEVRKFFRLLEIPKEGLKDKPVKKAVKKPDLRKSDYVFDTRRFTGPGSLASAMRFTRLFSDLGDCLAVSNAEAVKTCASEGRKDAFQHVMDELTRLKEDPEFLMAALSLTPEHSNFKSNGYTSTDLGLFKIGFENKHAKFLKAFNAFSLHAEFQPLFFKTSEKAAKPIDGKHRALFELMMCLRNNWQENRARYKEANSKFTSLYIEVMTNAYAFLGKKSRLLDLDDGELEVINHISYAQKAYERKPAFAAIQAVVKASTKKGKSK